MDQPGLKGAALRFWQRSYAADYLGFVLLLLAYVGVCACLSPVLLAYLSYFQSKLLITPFHRYFTLDDHAIAYPHALIERVSAIQNVIYAGVCPLIFFIIYAAIVRPGFHKAHVTILGLLISLTLTSFITDVIKNAVGRPRPDLISRCKPAPGTSLTDILTIDVCSTPHDDHVLNDGWKSFPSGHSSFSFAGLGYLSLWLGGQLHVLRPGTDLARFLVCLAPLTGALLIALSRMADYRCVYLCMSPSTPITDNITDTTCTTSALAAY